MKSKFLCVFIIFLASCRTIKNVAGNYKKVGNDFRYTLTLYRNHTFLLKEEFFEASPECKGDWHYLGKDTLLLECEKENPMFMLRSGYMSDRVQKVVILGHHQIKLQQVILTREIN